MSTGPGNAAGETSEVRVVGSYTQKWLYWCLLDKHVTVAVLTWITNTGNSQKHWLCWWSARQVRNCYHTHVIYQHRKYTRKWYISMICVAKAFFESFVPINGQPYYSVTWLHCFSSSAFFCVHPNTFTEALKSSSKYKTVRLSRNKRLSYHADLEFQTHTHTHAHTCTHMHACMQAHSDRLELDSEHCESVPHSVLQVRLFNIETQLARSVVACRHFRAL